MSGLSLSPEIAACSVLMALCRAHQFKLVIVVASGRWCLDFSGNHDTVPTAVLRGIERTVSGADYTLRRPVDTA